MDIASIRPISEAFGVSSGFPYLTSAKATL